MAQYWKLQVGLPLSEFDTIEQVFDAGLHLEKALGFFAGDSGIGFGFRDMEFTFDSLFKAEAAKPSSLTSCRS